jgi:1-deoxy-D-xylulose-5-phosphate synthase
MVGPALEAARILAEAGISCGVVNARFVKPLDEDLILDLAGRVDLILTVEEAQRMGGFGSAIAELLQDRGPVECRIESMAIPDAFIEHAKPNVQRANAGLTAESIAARAQSAFRMPRALRGGAVRPA